MKYQIDQSGKIEHSSQVTIVAVANDKVKTIFLGAAEKQILIRIMRQVEHPKKMYIFKIFSSLVFLLIKNEKIDQLIIDREYPGHEADIKLFLITRLKRVQKKTPEIEFAEIGKHASAHKNALAVFQKKKKPDIIVRAKELLGVIYENKKIGWRSQSCRDNP